MAVRCGQMTHRVGREAREVVAPRGSAQTTDGGAGAGPAIASRIPLSRPSGRLLSYLEVTMTVKQIIESSHGAFMLWWGYYSRVRVIERAAEPSEAKQEKRRAKPGRN